MRHPIRIAALGAAISILALAGCSAANQGAKNADVTIHVLSLGGDAWTKLVADFQKAHPHIHVVADTTTDVNLRANAVRLYDSSDAPDVSFMWNDARIWPTLIKNNLLLPIDDVWKTDVLAKAYQNSVVKQYTAPDGHHYGVNTDQVWAPLVYFNEDIFAKAGITDPAGRVVSMDEWNAMIAKLKAIKVPPLAVGGNDFSIMHTFDQFLNTTADPKQFNEYLTSWNTGSTGVTYNSDPFVGALQPFVDWQKAGVFAPGTAGMTDAQANALFTAGGAAMYQSGSWSAGTFKSQFKVGWTLYPPAVGQDSSHFLTYNGNALVIPKKAKEPAAAKTFIEWVMSKDVQTSWPGVPGRTDINPADLTNVPQQDKDMLAKFKEFGTSALWGDAVPPELGEGVRSQLGTLLTGESTPQKVGDSAQKTWLKVAKK